MSEHKQSRKIAATSHQDQGDILTPAFMNEIMLCVKAIFNPILHLHCTHIDQQIGVPSFEVGIRKDWPHLLQVGPITDDKHLVRMTATAFNGETFLRGVGSDDNMGSSVGASFQEE